jgi:hypothetical protein
VLKTIEPLQFEQMVLHKEIAKLTIIKNKDIAEITLKKEALPKYKSELGDQQGNGVMSQNSVLILNYLSTPLSHSKLSSTIYKKIFLASNVFTLLLKKEQESLNS